MPGLSHVPLARFIRVLSDHRIKAAGGIGRADVVQLSLGQQLGSLDLPRGIIDAATGHINIRLRPHDHIALRYKIYRAAFDAALPHTALNGGYGTGGIGQGRAHPYAAVVAHPGLTQVHRNRLAV